MNIHLHAEDTRDPICSFVSESVPRVDDIIVYDQDAYKVETVKYLITSMLREAVPECHGFPLYKCHLHCIVSSI